MSTQLPLSPVRHLYRATDPRTSGIAADRHDASGKRLANREKVLVAVGMSPGSTAAEIGVFTMLGHIEAQRRLSDLKNAHLVCQGGQRRCLVKGSLMVTWWPVAALGEREGGA